LFICLYFFTGDPHKIFWDYPGGLIRGGGLIRCLKRGLKKEYQLNMNDHVVC